MDKDTLINAFFNPGKNRFSKWAGYIGLGIGVLLLLSSLQLFININAILKENNPSKNGSDYLSVTKLITNDNMGSDHTFKEAELAQLNHVPEIEKTAPLISNQFRVKASAGNIVPFTTDLFLESIENDFIDTLPASFTWQPGQTDVPIIFSSDFLEIYNVFAPTQDLPQVSDKTISSVNIILECYGPKGMQAFRGNIVALSDRINSVLVPKRFMNWANLTFGGVSNVNPSRIYIKTRDANNPALLTVLEQKGYKVNKDKTKFGRVKEVLQNIVSGLAIFGILVIMMALMLFSFYLQLMIAKSSDNLRLLLTLGYSPARLSKTVARKWIPVYLSIILFALILTEVLHFAFLKISFVDTTGISSVVHWSVVAIALCLFALSVFVNYKLVKKELYVMV